MKSKSTIAKLTAFAFFAATLTIYTASRMGAAVNAAPPTRTQTEVTTTTEFEIGGISIGRGQTASIIAILRPDSAGRDEQPVQVEYSFCDRVGNVLASETKTLLPGHASSLEISEGLGVSQRSLLSPRIKVFASNGSVADRVVGTLEVSDTNTGKTQFALSCRKAGGDTPQ